MSVSPSPISLTVDPHKLRGHEWLDPAALTGRSFYYACKRCFDLVLGLALCVFSLPVMLLIAALIKFDSRGSLLFVNRAVGQHGHEFRLFKFRSMRPTVQSDLEQAALKSNLLKGAPTKYEDGRPVYKTAHAEKGRITRIGRFLRRTSLDELPQLWNILRGDMSFVGPRPSLPSEVSLYTDWQKQRLLVPQGLTGLYQVTARNRVPIDEMILIDIEYIRKRSFWTDLKIICKSPRAMLSGL